MTKEEALKKLKSARKREVKARKEKNELMAFLLKKGVDVYVSTMREKRDKKIYLEYLKGKNFTEISKWANVTPERCRSLYRRMEYRINKLKDEI